MKNSNVQKVLQALSNLVQKSRVRNTLIAAYVLIVLGFSATARAQMQTMPIFVDQKPVQTKTYAGEIAVTVDGDTYLVLSETKAFHLKSNIDLTSFNGQSVEVEGYEIKYHSGPVVQTSLMSLDPLQGDEGLRAEPVLIVFGIREISSQE